MQDRQEVRSEARSGPTWRLAVATPIAMVLFLVTHLAVGVPAMQAAERFDADDGTAWTSLGVAVVFAVEGLFGAVVMVPLAVLTLGRLIDRWGKGRPLGQVVAASGAAGIGIALAFAAACFASVAEPVGDPAGGWSLTMLLVALTGLPPVVAAIGTPLILPVAVRIRWLRLTFLALVVAVPLGALGVAWLLAR